MKIIESPVNSFEYLTHFVSDKESSFFYIDGDKIVDKQSFLKEFAVKMRFPDYFGYNWDAFDECITDLEWLNQNGFIIFYKNFNKFKINQPEDWKIATDVLLEAVEYWKQRNIPMLIIFL